MRREISAEGIDRDPMSCVTVGSFDGIHLGHREILRYLIDRSRVHGGSSTVVSFDPHPRDVLTGVVMPLLTTIEERAREFEALGLDRFIVLEFTQTFAEMTAERFVEDILVNTIGLREIVVGHDHRFGKDRRGDVALLRKMGASLGFLVDVIPARMVGQSVVSSSTIRRLLAQSGNVRGAAALLSRPHSITGTVIRGAGKGRTLGFPTANIRLSEPRKVIPLSGVYAVRVRTGGITYGGMMNIGVRPTVMTSKTLHVEAHLFDFGGDLYGQSVEVWFIERLRDELAFPSLEELRAQLVQDELRSRALLDS